MPSRLDVSLEGEDLGLLPCQGGSNFRCVGPPDGNRLKESLRSLLTCLRLGLKDAEGLLVALRISLAKAEQRQIGAKGNRASVDGRLRDRRLREDRAAHVFLEALEMFGFPRSHRYLCCFLLSKRRVGQASLGKRP